MKIFLSLLTIALLTVGGCLLLTEHAQGSSICFLLAIGPLLKIDSRLRAELEEHRRIRAFLVSELAMISRHRDALLDATRGFRR